MRLLLAMVCAGSALLGQTLQQAEALWKKHRYDDANGAFRALVAAHPGNAEYRVRWGRLFLERFQPDDAAKLFNEALLIEPRRADALLGLALVAADGFEAKAVELAHRALAADPHLVEAQELLARLGDDLRLVFITSRADVHLREGELEIKVAASGHVKCERCWHYRSDVGSDANHPTLCGRCVSNLFGNGEARRYA